MYVCMYVCMYVQTLKKQFLPLQRFGKLVTLHIGLGNLAEWLKDRSYEESLINGQIDRVYRLDRETLLFEADWGTNPRRGIGFH